MAKATKKVEEAKEVVKTPKVKKITLAEKAAALRQDLSSKQDTYYVPKRTRSPSD